MASAHEVGPTGFISAIGQYVGDAALYAVWQQQSIEGGLHEAGGTQTQVEVSPAEYLVHVNTFVATSARTIRAQQQNLNYMRAGMTAAQIASAEEEIKRAADANAEALGQAHAYLQSRGLPLRTRHPVTGEIGIVGAIGIDEAFTYQTLVPGYDEPWDLVDGNQLHF